MKYVYPTFEWIAVTWQGSEDAGILMFVMRHALLEVSELEFPLIYQINHLPKVILCIMGRVV